MQDAVNAITFALDQNHLPRKEGKTLIMGLRPQGLRQAYPEASLWSVYASDNTWHDKLELYDTIVILAPQQKDSLNYMIATALTHLNDGGLLVMAASNDAGGKTLHTQLSFFGLNVASLSKHKCRVVWSYKSGHVQQNHLETALKNGAMRQRTDGLWTQAGVFCWDRSDKGSLLLKTYIPETLTGNIGDFGAGIGELGCDVFFKNPTIQSLTSVEHDHRALDCAVKNLQSLGDRHHPLWIDIQAVTHSNYFDTIVMNPPFHEAKTTTLALGDMFVRKAFAALKRKGQLWMVTNAHLPYETILTNHFTDWSEIVRANGFKIFQAIK